uniref:Reverse transcriptase domain-containing protein n=1 Tax=Vitis vinifera TaxID=29760 RepID=A5C543_VITVI|nr:hypothetical protein VITISV_001932 [Vitis vinifera]
MKIISWNTKGLGSRKKRRVVKDFLRLENPDVVMFRETKRDVCDRRFVGSVWSVRNKEWAALPLVERFLGKWLGRHKFMRKLQYVKAKLKEWNKDSFRVLKERKKSILSEIANIDAAEQEEVLSPELSAQRALRKGELEELILREEVHWTQKARVKWVKEGDCNSKFFHKVANGRRNRKFIKFLENERGLVLNNTKSITEEILLYYEKLYSSPPGESWKVEGLDWSPILEESASRLDSPFTEEEISKAIFQLDRDKTPGPDGFTIAVFQDCWDVIKEDLVRVFAEFHRSAFVQGRQILDAILIANEIVDEKRRSGKEGVIFKIGIFWIMCWRRRGLVLDGGPG